MAMFGRGGDPGLKLLRDTEAKLAATKNQRDENAARLATAEAKLLDARALADARALEADDAALDAALQARRAAEDKVTALKHAAAKIGAEVATLEREVATINDQRTRTATALSIGKLIDRWTAHEAAFVEAAAELEKDSQEIALMVLDANGTTAFLMAAKTEVPPAGAVILEGLRQYAAGVIAGRQRATLPQLAPEPPRLKIVAPATRTIFARANLAFIDASGKIKCHPRMNDIELPVDLADEAVAKRAAVEVADPFRRQYHGTHNALTPSLANCIKIGKFPSDAGTAPQQTSIPSSHFEPHPDPRRASQTPYPASVDAAMPVAVGMRTLAPEE